MNKRFALVLIAGIIALSLSACESSTASSTSSATNSAQTSSSAQYANSMSNDLKSEYKEAVDYVSSDQCKNFRTRSQDLVGIAYGDLIAEGDAAAIDDVVEEYSSLVADLPDAYDKPQSTKELYAYLNIWGEYQVRILPGEPVNMQVRTYILTCFVSISD